MSITVPGPRLMRRTVPHFVRARARAAAAGAIVPELSLTPLLDLLLALVLFLLSLAGNQTCPLNLRGLPLVDHHVPMTEAPFVVVGSNQVLVDGTPAGETRNLVDDGRVMVLPELLALLKNKRELWQMLHPGRRFPGQVVLRVEGEVPSVVVKSAVHSAARAGYEEVSFAVRPRGR